MPSPVAAILVVVWLARLVASWTMGGRVSILLVIPIVVIVPRLIRCHPMVEAKM